MKDKTKIISFEGRNWTLYYHYQPKMGYPFDYESVCLRIKEDRESLGYKTIPLSEFQNIESLKKTLRSLIPKDPEEIFDIDFVKWNGNL